MPIKNQIELTKSITTPSGETVQPIFGPEVGTPSSHSFAQVSVAVGGCSIKHYHPACEETYYIQSGKGVMLLDDKEQTVGPGDSVWVPAKTAHKISNYYTTNTPESEPLKFVVVCVPPWDPDCSVFLE